MLFLPDTNSILLNRTFKMTTIQKMMKQVAEQEKKQQAQAKQQQEQKETIENLHLYIPYAFDNVSKEQMRENLSGFGKIKVIDFVAKLDKKNMNYNSAYIYFDCWYPTPENKKIQAQIRQFTKSQNKLHSFKLNYDGNLHWIILENTSPSAHPKQERKAMIDLKTPAQEPAPPAQEQEPAKQEEPSPPVKQEPVKQEPVKQAPVKQAPPRTPAIIMKQVSIDDINVPFKYNNYDDMRISYEKRRIEEMMIIEEHEKKFPPQYKKIQEQEQEQEQEQDQDQEQYPSQMTQAFYYYYYMMQMEHREMDEITDAIDEEDAWSQHLEQIEQECDFCEDIAGDQEQGTQYTFNVDYEYVQMLELELAKLRTNI